MIGATLRGGGTVTRGTLHFADLLNKRIVNLEDTLFRAVIDTTLLRRQGLTRGFQNRFIDSLVVDSLRMGMGSEAWLRSTEANIQLSGTVVFSKMADQYRMEGTLSALRGTYQLPLGVQIATRQFTVSRGQLRFLGTPDLNALVDIDAQYVVRRRVGENINVTVHIGGTLYEPTVLLASDVQPPLPQSEIISYLIFGRPLDPNAVGAQASQALVQGALSSLAGQIENSLVANLGLPIAPDYFELSPGEQGLSGTQVQFGWQIHPFGIPAFLTPSARICPGHALLNPADAGVSLEFRLSKEWRVASSVEPIRTCTNTGALPTGSRQFGVDVFWEKNY